MDRTERLFDKDSHLKEFECRVESCVSEGNIYKVIVDKTAFFPEGGGQDADTGYLGDVRVSDVQERDGIIYHEVDAPVEVGSTIKGRIDWDKRFVRMQHHTGEHIVSGIVNSMYGYDNVGFHMGSDAVTMDFNGELSDRDIAEIERRANEAVYSDIVIEAFYPSAEELSSLEYRSKIELDGDVRIVRIEGYDICACCAPHVYSTGMIGAIKIVGCQKYKGGVRVSLLCGREAMLDYANKADTVMEISRLLSLKPDEVAEGVRHLREDNSSLKNQIVELNRQLLSYRAAQIEEGTEDICIFDNKLDASLLRTYANMVTERCSGVVYIFAGDDETGYRYVISSKNTDVRPLSKQINSNFNGRGGGSMEMAQGSITGTMEDIKASLQYVTE